MERSWKQGGSQCEPQQMEMVMPPPLVSSSSVWSYNHSHSWKLSQEIMNYSPNMILHSKLKLHNNVQNSIYTITISSFFFNDNIMEWHRKPGKLKKWCMSHSASQFQAHLSFLKLHTWSRIELACAESLLLHQKLFIFSMSTGLLAQLSIQIGFWKPTFLWIWDSVGQRLEKQFNRFQQLFSKGTRESFSNGSMKFWLF